MLRSVAERLKESLRESDAAGRFGGDEFVAVLDDVGDASEALKVAERLQEGLRVPFEMEGGNRMYTSASIGIAVGSREGPEALVRKADEASYRAKRGGKARSVLLGGEPETGSTP